MQIDSAEKLIEALGTCGLFDSEQLKVIASDLAPISGDIQTLLKHLVIKKRITAYQLRKVIHGKSAELFLGSYIITDKIGEGGMGKVYRARQVRLNRVVALKIVRSSLLSNQIVRKRFDREVETASALNHPNIVGVYDAGEIQGRYYLAMEFVDGIDLSRLMREYRQLEIAEACEYARQTALGLHYAHEQGFVHRDIKPSNIVVAGERHIPQATEPSVVKILDMGLVRTVGFDDGGGGGDLTRAGTVVGTPDYMAPEQAKNSSGVDRRADLYSLGCTLYFLLSGQPPFPSGTPIEKLLKHQLEAPIPLQALRPAVPSTLAEILAKLITKDPDLRFSSAAEVADLLSPLSYYPTGALPVPILSRRDKSGRSNSETLPPSGQSTVQPPGSHSSTIQPGFTGPEPIPLAEAIAPSDHTPRPPGLPAQLHTNGEETSPFSSLDEPNSEMFPSVSYKDKSKHSLALPQRTQHWIIGGAVLVVLVLLAIGIGLLIASGGRRAPQDHSNADSPSNATGDNSTKPPSRTGIVPSFNLSRLHSWLDLIESDPGLVVVGFPSTYLREKDSPYARGSGPGKFGSWAEQFATSTSLLLARSDRIVFSTSSRNSSQFLLVSEGDYLTPSFGTTLTANTNLRPFKPSEKLLPTVKLFQAPISRFTALIPHSSGSQVYALSSNQALISGLGNRLAPRDKTAQPPNLDAGMLTALSATTVTPPLIHAVAGPGFQLPFSFQSVEKDTLTLQDFGLELMTLRIRILERMEIEFVLTGRDEKAVEDFLSWVRQRIRDEYPIDGAPILGLLTNAEKSGTSVEGKYKLTLKATWTSAQWSAFLDKLFV